MNLQLTDIGAERAVLSGLFNYGVQAYVEISDFITHQTFGHLNNQILYKCIEKAIQNEAEIDLPSILSAAKQLGFYESVNTKQELEYINSLMKFPIKKENILHFAGQIKKFEFARKIKSLNNKISSDIDAIAGDESIDDILKIVEEPIMEFLRQDTVSEKPEKIGEGVEEYYQFLIENKCDQIGVSSGFPR